MVPTSSPFADLSSADPQSQAPEEDFYLHLHLPPELDLPLPATTQIYHQPPSSYLIPRWDLGPDSGAFTRIEFPGVGKGKGGGSQEDVDTFETIRMPYTGAVISDKLLASNPGLVKRYLRATLKGMRYMRTFRAETNAILKRLGADEDDRTLEVNYTAVVATLTDKGEEANEVLKNDMAVRASLLNIPPDQVRPVKDVYDYTLLREANDELDKAGWKPTP